MSIVIYKIKMTSIGCHFVNVSEGSNVEATLPQICTIGTSGATIPTVGNDALTVP